MTQDGDEELTADAAASEEEREAEKPGDAGAENDDTESAELQILRDHAEANHDKYLRAVAELENVRKRAARDVQNARRYGLERLARALLPVRDSLEAGLASADQDAPEGYPRRG